MWTYHLQNLGQTRWIQNVWIVYGFQCRHPIWTPQVNPEDATPDDKTAQLDQMSNVKPTTPTHIDTPIHLNPSTFEGKARYLNA